MAKSAGQLSAAISAEVKRGQLRRFYVKQIESAHVREFGKISDEELERFIEYVEVLCDVFRMRWFRETIF